MSIEELRKNQAQVIRLLEDAVHIESLSSIYFLIGKLTHIQAQIEMLEEFKEWRNEE